jgi:hypothetical protein
MRKLLTGISAGLAVCGTAAGQEARPRPPLVAPFHCAPVVPLNPACPPGTILPGPGVTIPSTPGSPGTPDQPGAGPQVAPAPRQADGDGAPQFAASTRGGGLDVDRYNINMFADILGARSLSVTYNVPFTAQFGLGGATTTASGGSAFRVNPNAPGSFIRLGPTPNGTTFRGGAPFSSGDLSYVQPTTGGVANFDRAFAQAALQSILSAGQLTPEQVLAFNQLSPADRAQLLASRGAINAQITRATGGLTVPVLTVSGVNGGVVNANAIEYTAQLTGQQVIALPGASSSVGRVKMSEDNSPIPRDRFIFTYDSFGDVPFTADGMNVNRFQFGLEKTFLDGRWSAEVRLPFAGTLASTYSQGAEVKDVEFGNLRLAVKRILTQSRFLTVSTGLGVALPTAKDQTVLSLLDDSVLYRFRNRSVQLEPFVAALFTPTDRLFGQVWSSVNFDASGSDLSWNPAVFGGSGSAQVWDLPILSVDGQVGYWLIQNGGGAIRGLAPFAELHWNETLAQNQLVKAVGDNTAGQGLSVSAIGTRELNLSAGLLCQVGDNMNLSVGAAVPLLQRPDRTFNWQIGVRASYFFGNSARPRTSAAMVSTY